VKDRKIIGKTIGHGLAADWLKIFIGGRKNEKGKSILQPPILSGIIPLYGDKEGRFSAGAGGLESFPLAAARSASRPLCGGGLAVSEGLINCFRFPRGHYGRAPGNSLAKTPVHRNPLVALAQLQVANHEILMKHLGKGVDLDGFFIKFHRFSPIFYFQQVFPQFIY
jgi:hypothetical protein